MKKLLVLLLAVCIMAMSVVPAFATQADVAPVSTPDQVEPEIEVSARVQAYYDAYTALVFELNGEDFNDLNDAFDNFMNVTSGEEELTEEEYEQLVALFGTEDIWGVVEKLIDVSYISYYVIDMVNAQKDFENDPCFDTAFYYVSIYEEVFVDSEEDDLKLYVSNFNPDADEIYEDAYGYMPSAEVMALYDAYEMLCDALYYGEDDLEILQIATDKFADAWNGANFSDEDVQALAAMLYEDPEEVMSILLSDYIDACIIVETGKLYNAYLENPDADTAQALVDMYDSIFEDETYDNVQWLLEWFIPDLAEVYDEAVQLAQVKPQESPESTKDEEKATANTATVKTGNTAVYVIVIVSGALVLFAGAYLRRREK